MTELERELERLFRDAVRNKLERERELELERERALTRSAGVALERALEREQDRALGRIENIDDGMMWW